MFQRLPFEILSTRKTNALQAKISLFQQQPNEQILEAFKCLRDILQRVPTMDLKKGQPFRVSTMGLQATLMNTMMQSLEELIQFLSLKLSEGSAPIDKVVSNQGWRDE